MSSNTPAIRPHVEIVNGQLVTNSFKIAEHFGKQHKNVHGMVYWEPHAFQHHIPPEEFLERSAIMEFDGGMSRSESMRAAKHAYVDHRAHP